MKKFYFVKKITNGDMAVDVVDGFEIRGIVIAGDEKHLLTDDCRRFVFGDNASDFRSFAISFDIDNAYHILRIIESNELNCSTKSAESCMAFIGEQYDELLSLRVDEVVLPTRRMKSSDEQRYVDEIKRKIIFNLTHRMNVDAFILLEALNWLEPYRPAKTRRLKTNSEIFKIANELSREKLEFIGDYRVAMSFYLKILFEDRRVAKATAAAVAERVAQQEERDKERASKFENVENFIGESVNTQFGLMTITSVRDVQNTMLHRRYINVKLSERKAINPLLYVYEVVRGETCDQTIDISGRTFAYNSAVSGLKGGVNITESILRQLLSGAHEKDCTPTQPEPAQPDLYALVGKSVEIEFGTKKDVLSVEGLKEWKGGNNKRIYIQLDCKKCTPIHSLYMIVDGTTRDDVVEVAGKKFGFVYGNCNSGSKRDEAKRAVKELLSNLE